MAKKTKKKLPPQNRPKLLSDDDIEKLSRLAGLGLPTDKMAHILGVSEATLERRMNDQPGVAEAVKKGKAESSEQLRSWAFKKAQAGDTAMIIFLLKTREGFREAPKEVNMRIGEIEKLPHEQIIKIGKEAIEYLEASDGEGE